MVGEDKMYASTPSQTELTKRKICKKVERMVGYPVTGLGDILSILTGPDVLPLLETYISEKKREE